MTDETPMKKGVGEGECYCIENARCHHHAPRDGQLVAKWDGRSVSDDETAGEGPVGETPVCPKCGGPTEVWEQEGRGYPAIRCITNGCTWTIPGPVVALLRSLTERAERAEAALKKVARIAESLTEGYGASREAAARQLFAALRSSPQRTETP